MRQMLTGWKKSEVRAAREEQLARAKGTPDPSDPNAKKVFTLRLSTTFPFCIFVFYILYTLWH